MSTLLSGLTLGIGIVLLLSLRWDMPKIHIRPPRWYTRYSDQIVRSRIKGLTPIRLVFFDVILVVVIIAAAALWSGALPIAVILGCVSAPLPFVIVVQRAERNAKKMRQAWPDVIDSLVSGVRAGASLPDLLVEVGLSGPEELRPYFVAFAHDFRADGRFDKALTLLKDRCADPVADRIVEALRLARSVGGSNLSQLLRDLGVLLREDTRIRGELEARQSWTVNAARLGIAAPWLVLLMISSQAHAAQAYSTPEGVGILLGGAVACFFAYLMMRRIGRLSNDQRSLR